MTYISSSSLPDKHSIDALMKLLLKLNGTKGLETIEVEDIDRIWVGESMLERLFDLEYWEHDMSLVSEVKSSLRSLRNVGRLLHNLQESLEPIVKGLERELLPFEFGRGLSSLPDSVVSQILEIECTQKPFVGRKHVFVKEIAPQTRLSLVCRRFRHIVSTNPRLWSHIYSDLQGLRSIRAFTEKSKAASLNIYLECPFYYESQRTSFFSDALSILITHSHRWTSVKLSFWKKLHSDIDYLINPLKLLRLPRLHTLKVVFPHEVRRSPYPHPSWHFYKTFGMPMLRSFKIKHAVPEPFAAPLLTSLAINLDGRNVHTKQLTEFLSHYRTLEDFSLDLHNAWALDPQGATDIVLENVKVLNLRLDDTPLDRMYRLRKALRTPNVQKIVFTTKNEHAYDPDHYRAEYGADGLKDDTFPKELKQKRCSNAYLNFALCHESYPQLEHLSFIHYGGNDNKYDIPFEKMPKLGFLELQTRSVPDIDQLYKIPPLRELHVDIHWQPKRSVSDWERWLEKVHLHMDYCDTLSRLEKLVVVHNYTEDRSEERMKKLFGQRIVWKRYNLI